MTPPSRSALVDLQRVAACGFDGILKNLPRNRADVVTVGKDADLIAFIHQLQPPLE